MKKSRLLVIAICVLLALTFAGCGKENKYVKMGVNDGTDGMSLMLTGYTHSLQGVSNYVFFAKDVDETLDKINLDAQNIEISYFEVKDFGKLTKDMPLKVVFLDTFEKDGSLKGVWIAREQWLEDAPNYSKKFLKGLVKCEDYRAANMNMSYADAYESVKGIRDVDFDVQSDVMQFIAIYSQNNKESIRDVDFAVKDVASMQALLEGFEAGKGEGYELCKAAYDRYAGSDSKSFEELFDLSVMETVVDEFLNPEE